EKLVGQAASEAALGKTKEALAHYEAMATALQKSNAPVPPQFNAAMLELRINEQMRKPKEERDWKNVDALFAKIRDAGQTKQPGLSLTQLRMLSIKGEKQQAQQLVKDLRKQYPDNTAVLSSALGMAIGEHNLDEVTQIINSVPESLRNHPVVLMARIQALF